MLTITLRNQVKQACAGYNQTPAGDAELSTENYKKTVRLMWPDGYCREQRLTNEKPLWQPAADPEISDDH